MVGLAPFPTPHPMIWMWSLDSIMSLVGPMGVGGSGEGQLVYGRGSKHGDHYIFKLSLEESLRWNDSCEDTTKRAALRSLYCAIICKLAQGLGCVEYTIITHTRRTVCEGVVA